MNLDWGGEVTMSDDGLVIAGFTQPPGETVNVTGVQAANG
jgi:hypothetical protein